MAEPVVAFPVLGPFAFLLLLTYAIWLFRLAIERLRIMNLRSKLAPPVVLLNSLGLFLASGYPYFLSGVTERPVKAKLAGLGIC